jgi:hypothetical protein
MAQLSITPEVKLEEWKMVAPMAENNACNVKKTPNRTTAKTNEGSENKQ